MGFFSWFDVRRKVRELEDALVMVVEEQDSMRDSIRGVQQSVGGLKGAASRWHSSLDPILYTHEGDPPTELEPIEMTDKEFVEKYGIPPKEYASHLVRTGVWK